VSEWKAQVVIILTVGLIALSIAGYAEADAPCHTKDGAAKDGAIVAPSLAGLKHALSIMRSGDAAAWNKLLE
jgi:hypothetical protein